LHTARLDALVEAALAEDIGRGDATTEATVAATLRARARVVARAHGVIAGRSVFEAVFRSLSQDCSVVGVEDGASVRSDETVWELEGPARALLSGERVALNFVQRLSGIATRTRQYVQAVAGTGVAITDTRKTTPTLRFLEKHAVRCGGGENHRDGLDDMLLLKENHVAAAGGLEAAVRAAQRAAAGRALEVEVRTREELRCVIELGVQRVLLDHWSPGAVGEAVRLRGPVPPPELEVSGNLNLETIRDFAIPGVQYLSVGELTHSASALDLSMLFSGAQS
jgi:nicotinate-nucleotide pyrophosphorylase (carboxylating)